MKLVRVKLACRRTVLPTRTVTIAVSHTQTHTHTGKQGDA
jgi:hypothetical protein